MTEFLILLQIYLIWLASVLVHELGHMYLGWMVGYRWKHIVVGPLKLTRETGKLRLTMSDKFLGGEILNFPRADDHQLLRAFLLLGGPLGTILCLVVCLAVILPRLDNWEHVPWQWYAAAVIAAYKIPLNLLPRVRGRQVNDAAQLLNLWLQRDEWARVYANQRARTRSLHEKDARTRRNNALRVLQTEDARTLRPRDWSQGLLRQACELRDGSMNECIAAFFAFYAAVDTGNIDAAGDCLFRALNLAQTLPPDSRAMLFLDAAYYFGLFRRDAGQSLHYRECARGIYPSTELLAAAIATMLERANAALAFSQGKFTEALAFAQRSSDLTDALVARPDYPGKALDGKALLERLVDKCNEEIRSSTLRQGRPG